MPGPSFWVSGAAHQDAKAAMGRSRRTRRSASLPAHMNPVSFMRWLDLEWNGHAATASPKTVITQERLKLIADGPATCSLREWGERNGKCRFSFAPNLNSRSVGENCGILSFFWMGKDGLQGFVWESELPVMLETVNTFF